MLFNKLLGGVLDVYSLTLEEKTAFVQFLTPTAEETLQCNGAGLIIGIEYTDTNDLEVENINLTLVNQQAVFTIDCDAISLIEWLIENHF